MATEDLSPAGLQKARQCQAAAGSGSGGSGAGAAGAGGAGRRKWGIGQNTSPPPGLGNS